MARYRAALIGLGRIASTIDDEVSGIHIKLPYSHTACYRAVPEIEVVAGADMYAEQRDEFGRRWGVERLYADYREMLEIERPDIVSVTTSARPRAGIVVDCARAGARVVYLEKPISVSLAEADAMVAACRERGVKLAIGCTWRWDPDWETALGLIAAGEIGRVLQVTLSAGTSLSHGGSHLIDLARLLAGGSVRWVFGEIESDEKAASDDDLMGNGYLAFDNGVRGYLRTWPSGGADYDIEVMGERGGIRGRLNGSEYDWWQTGTGGWRGGLVWRDFPRDPGAPSQQLRVIHDLVACLDTVKEPNCTGEDGRAALEVAIVMRESHRQGGRRIDLPLADRSLRMRSSEDVGSNLPRALRPRG